MKEDIQIPKVEGVIVAAVLEKNNEFQSLDWNAYLINDREEEIDTILIVSKGFTESKTTSTMRHSLKILPSQSFAKIEFLQDEILDLDNEFSVSFFLKGKMYHKKYLFKRNSINREAMEPIPVMGKRGVLLR